MADEVVHGALDIGRVLALRGRRALAQQGRGRKRGDGGGIACPRGPSNGPAATAARPANPGPARSCGRCPGRSPSRRSQCPGRQHQSTIAARQATMQVRRCRRLIITSLYGTHLLPLSHIRTSSMTSCSPYCGTPAAPSTASQGFTQLAVGFLHARAVPHRGLDGLVGKGQVDDLVIGRDPHVFSAGSPRISTPIPRMGPRRSLS